MKKKRKKWVLFLFAAFAISSCKHPEQTVAPIISNETLTTVQLRLTNTQNASDTLTAQWEQLLNALGMPLPVDTNRAFLNLKANSIYTCQVHIFDKTQTPPAEITAEIQARGTYHLFFYQPTPIAPGNLIISTNSTDIPGTPTSPTGPYLNLTIVRDDYDTNNPPLPIGLSTTFTTGATSNGNLRVVLRHQPDAKNGTYAPGSSDLDVNYRVSIQ